MKIAEVRRFAMALPETTEQPHFQSTSFRVRGKIFATAPPGDDVLHVFVDEEQREAALTLEPTFLDKLYWGKKVWGLRVVLAKAKPKIVEKLLTQAWKGKAPKTLVAESDAPIDRKAPAKAAKTSAKNKTTQTDASER